MKLYRTVGRGYVYQPYLCQGDVMVDPRDQKIMLNKCNMIFIRKKGIPPQPSSVAKEVEEEEEEAEGEEVDTKVNVEQKGVVEGEVGSRSVKRTKFDKLQQEFEEFKAETESNFVTVRQQLQNYQSKNSANFEVVIKLLESLKADI